MVTYLECLHNKKAGLSVYIQLEIFRIFHFHTCLKKQNSYFTLSECQNWNLIKPNFEDNHSLMPNN